MKTIILFSSIFYLLGLKLGGTLSFFRHLAAPVKSVISLPAQKSESPADDGKSYFFHSEKAVRDVSNVRKDTVTVTPGQGQSDPSATTSGKQQIKKI